MSDSNYNYNIHHHKSSSSTSNNTNMINSNFNFAFLQPEGNLAMERLSTTSPVARGKINPGRSLKKGMTALPPDFEVSNYSVLCGRGKGCYNATGNRRLRVLVGTFLQQYIDSQNSPHDKSRLIEKVVKMVREACPVGAFIKYENGTYYELSDKGSKEKVAALFRDYMLSSYKDQDTKCKQAKKKQRPSLPTSLPQIRIPPKQITCEPQPSTLRDFQMQLFQEQQHKRSEQQSQEEEPIPIFGHLKSTEEEIQPLLMFGHLKPLATPLLQRGESGVASVCSVGSSSAGSFYDVDSHRSVSIPAFDDEIALIDIVSLMG